MSTPYPRSPTKRSALPTIWPRTKQHGRLGTRKARLAVQVLAVLCTLGTLAFLYSVATSTSANGIGWSGVHWLQRGASRARPAKVLQSPALPAPVDVVVLSIGLVQDPSKHAAQRATIGQDLRLYTVNETVLPHCYLCSDASFQRFPELWYAVKERFTGRSINWYCQQQRGLAALRWLLLEELAGKLPAWVLLVDEDVFVNPVNLKQLLREHDADAAAAAAPAFLGKNNGWKAEFWSYAGAGTLMNRAAMQALLQPFDTQQLTFVGSKWVNATAAEEAGSQAEASNAADVLGQRGTLLDECIKRQLGGSWCHMHSDWAVGLCIRMATGIQRPTQIKAMYPNKCPLSDGNKMAGLVTCSDVAADQLHYAYGQWALQHA